MKSNFSSGKHWLISDHWSQFTSSRKYSLLLRRHKQTIGCLFKISATNRARKTYAIPETCWAEYSSSQSKWKRIQRLESNRTKLNQFEPSDDPQKSRTFGAFLPSSSFSVNQRKVSERSHFQQPIIRCRHRLCVSFLIPILFYVVFSVFWLIDWYSAQVSVDLLFLLSPSHSNTASFFFSDKTA